MVNDRAARVWETVMRHAEQDGATPSLRHVCAACAEALSAAGVGFALTSSVGMFEPVSGTDPKVDELEELQATVGEGPGCEALVSGEPVLVDDLASPGSVTRWPVFAPAAVDRGVRGMFSFPAGRGAVHVGVLEVFRDVTGPLSPRDLGDAFAYTDLAMLLVLDSRGGIAASPAESTVRTGDGEAVLHSAEVHQAAGMLSVQLGIPVVDALLRLRARAFAQNVRLTELARSVVAREISFGPNGGSVSDSDLEGSA